MSKNRLQPTPLQLWMYEHGENHANTLVSECPICICRAVRAIESHSNNESAAIIFLDAIGTEAKLRALAQVREELGPNDTEDWMWKAEYMGPHGPTSTPKAPPAKPTVEYLTDGGELVWSEITSYGGKSSFYCKVCDQYMPVKYLVTGRSPATDERQTIYWKYVEDEHGHTLKDDSY